MKGGVLVAASLTNVSGEDNQSRGVVYPVGTRLLLFTVRVTLIRLITGSPHQQPALLQDVTDGDIPNNLNRGQYFNFLCKTNWYLTPIKKWLWLWSHSMTTFFNLPVRKVACSSAKDSDWKALFTQIWCDYTTILLQLLPRIKENEVITTDCTGLICPVFTSYHTCFTLFKIHVKIVLDAFTVLGPASRYMSGLWGYWCWDVHWDSWAKVFCHFQRPECKLKRTHLQSEAWSSRTICQWQWGQLGQWFLLNLPFKHGTAAEPLPTLRTLTCFIHPAGFGTLLVYVIYLFFYNFYIMHLKSFNVLSVLAGIQIEQCMKIKGWKGCSKLQKIKLCSNLEKQIENFLTSSITRIPQRTKLSTASKAKLWDDWHGWRETKRWR